MKVEVNEMSEYLKKHQDLCDDWTLKFVITIQDQIKKTGTISQKQYFILVTKCKDVYLSKNRLDLENDIKGKGQQDLF